ncbi:MAG: hypothetical protein CMO80_02645 [Verrucomicrobiales bacterium]|nr:hypothetical protein [Verrucomicrobiales bacterium]
MRYKAKGTPSTVTHCHCEDCRRSSAAPFVTWVSFPKSEFRFTNEAPGQFEWAGRIRTFSQDCGTSLTFATTAGPDRSPRFTSPKLQLVRPPTTCRRPGSNLSSGCRGLWASPYLSKLATTTGQIEFSLRLPTKRSLSVALHPASRRRSYVQLPGAGLTRTRTFTRLFRSAHGRTRMGNLPVLLKLRARFAQAQEILVRVATQIIHIDE